MAIGLYVGEANSQSGLQLIPKRSFFGFEPEETRTPTTLQQGLRQDDSVDDTDRTDQQFIQPRLIGGTDRLVFDDRGGQKIGEFDAIDLKEVVRISFDVTNEIKDLCTGIALSETLILSAGHCACGIEESYRIEFPSQDLNSQSAFYRALSLSSKPILFPGYDCTNAFQPQPGKDAALFRVNSTEGPDALKGLVIGEATLVDMPRIIDRALTDRSFEPLVVIAGYGKMLDGTFPDRLLIAQSAIEDPYCTGSALLSSNCASFKEFALKDRSNANVPGADTCGGDSGGPVYWVQDLVDGVSTKFPQRSLLGITSRALSGVPQFGVAGCGGGGIYTMTFDADMIAWIASNGGSFSTVRDQDE